jgi:hypothetical protein
MNKQERIEKSTPEKLNKEIREETYQNLQEYGGMSRVEINARMIELNREWDVERTLQLNAAMLALTGTLLGITVDKKWFTLPVVVTGFLLQHSIQGWCPPLPFFRSLGFRSRKEIELERHALKAMRGDYNGILNDEDEALQAAEKE